MTTPVGPDPTGKRAKLKGSRVALSLAVAAAIAARVLLSPTPQSSATVAALGCPDSALGAVVVHFADATPSGDVSRTDIQPLVICGSAQLAYQTETYVNWVAAGSHPSFNGAVRDTTTNPFDTVVVSPADTSEAFWDYPDSVLARADSLHWTIAPTARLRWKMLGGLIYSVLDSAQVPGIRDSTPVPVVGWWSYAPTRDGMFRTQMIPDSVIAATAHVLDMTIKRTAWVMSPYSDSDSDSTITPR